MCLMFTFVLIVDCFVFTCMFFGWNVLPCLN
jgi:hypothetical protein